MKKMILLYLLLWSAACAGAPKVDVETADKLIAKQVQILDVRTKSEWNKGHLEGAVRVDFKEAGFARKVVKAVDPKKPVLVYCHSGGRSARAARMMESLGFVELSDLRGGIVAWKKAGGKVVK